MTNRPARDDFDSARVSRLLRLGLSEKRTPVDELVDFLRGSGSEAFDALVREGPLASDAEALCAPGGARAPPADRYRELYDDAKRALAAASSREDRLSSLLAWFLVVACGRVHRGLALSSRRREDLDPLLLEIALLAPSPWDDLLTRAVAAADDEDA